MSRGFVVKDSGEREKFDSGMVRDTQGGKVLWHLIASGPMLKRWAIHLTKGAAKYGDDNWLKAEGMAEYLRFRASAFRHFMQWFLGDRDEDHASAVIFNINGAEYVQEKMDAGVAGVSDEQCQSESPVGYFCEKRGGHGGNHGTPGSKTSEFDW